MSRLSVIVLLLTVASTPSIGGCETEAPRLTLGDQCDLNSQCEAPLVCRIARCRLECATTRDCPIGQLCVTDAEGLGACLLADETTCDLDSDCPEPLVCLAGGCTNGCRIDRDCAPGARCATDSAGNRYCDDTASQRCTVDSECTPGVCAADGVCRDECRQSRDCRPGTVCREGLCTEDDPPDGGGLDGGPADGGGLDGATPTDAGPDDEDAGTVDGSVVVVSCSTPADCTAPGVAEADCVGGSCVVTSCGPGLEDCDGDFATGCEIDTEADPAHCGACGTSCGAWGRCEAGTCDGVVALSLGGSHGCYVRGSGLVLCMGTNSSGQLGDNTVGGTRSDPAPVYMLTDGRRVLAGDEATCVQRAGGELACFGDNESAQLGDGTFTIRGRPVVPAGLGAVASFTVGSKAGCAVDAAGQLTCQGGGPCGQSGHGFDVYVTVPTAVAGITDADHVSTWTTHTCAVHSDGLVSCWGENFRGQLGDGVTDHGTTCRTSTDASATPVTVSSITDAVQVGVGALWSCARHAGGTVSCWGINRGGWGSAHSGLAQSNTPLPIVGVTDAVDLTVGYDHACVRRSDGRVSCWGLNSQGQLGAGDLGVYEDAVEVVGLTDVVDVDAGWDSTCAADSAGAVFCWGYNGGSFGPDFLYERRSSPTPISLFP